MKQNLTEMVFILDKSGSMTLPSTDENGSKTGFSRNETATTAVVNLIRQMKEGIAADDMRKVLSITDRREAIRTAVALANKGDIILLAGKGHEDYQIIKGVKRHFDDKEELTKSLQEK